MTKKGGSSKKSSGSTKKSSASHRSSGNKETKLLVENFVALQKVMADMSEKFDKLTHQISELLKLFEDSAKVLVKSDLEKKKEDHGDKQLLNTMISILDQNKVIAKGLTLMYESMNNKNDSSSGFKADERSLSPAKPSPKKPVLKEEHNTPSPKAPFPRDPFSQDSFPRR